MKSKPNFSIESTIKGQVVGIDEAGRGPLAGPVYAASVILDKKNIPFGINDSKSLNLKSRERLYDKIIKSSFYGVSMATVNEIDRLNILQATLLAMRRSYLSLAWKLSKLPSCALIDGNQAPKLPCKSITVIKGDTKSISIAAASIIAKVSRDRHIKKLHLYYPNYDWINNFGYSSIKHRLGLTILGPSPHHRLTFKPLKRK
ncbi:MAG: Ribonuclease HII [Alphaproteobacteria bacterium MarineAlpha2_Bin1]|nr:MAG: Ribonuclease HII [Alphaproteobacteria bacterium MarineAlpha2_Bin1]|tara:strand:- start:1459 stop:2064 length:606 start_codon:yes stop_codon:yes gene_type:complete